jgi:hypothetical protein
MHKGEMMNYAQQIKHPMWQKKRLEVLELRGFQCQECGVKDEELHVHHPFYRRGAMIWEYEKEELECLCHKCHKNAHELDEQIKKALSTCKLKPLVLAYVTGLNDAASAPTFAKARNARKSALTKTNARPLLPPKEADTVDDADAIKSADAFFTKMKELMGEV